MERGGEGEDDERKGGKFEGRKGKRMNSALLHVEEED